MVGFIWVVALLAVILQLAYNKHKANAEQRRKELLIREFVEDALAKDELYPTWNWGHTLHGIVGGSAHRAAQAFGLDPHEAEKLINIELSRRGLSITDSD